MMTLYYRSKSKIDKCCKFLKQRTKCMSFKNKLTAQQGGLHAALNAVMCVDLRLALQLS